MTPCCKLRILPPHRRAWEALPRGCKATITHTLMCGLGTQEWSGCIMLSNRKFLRQYMFLSTHHRCAGRFYPWSILHHLLAICQQPLYMRMSALQVGTRVLHHLHHWLPLPGHIRLVLHLLLVIPPRRLVPQHFWSSPPCLRCFPHPYWQHDPAQATVSNGLAPSTVIMLHAHTRRSGRSTRKPAWHSDYDTIRSSSAILLVNE